MEEIPNIPETKLSSDAPLESSGSRMVPLSQVLAGYASNQASFRGNGQKPDPTKHANNAQSSGTRSLYRKALLTGFLLGIIGGCAALAAFLIVSS